jgi:ABC-type phosphate transport system auxiliary subunit
MRMNITKQEGTFMNTKSFILKSVFACLLCSSMIQPVQAGNAGMTEEQMQQMMQNAEKMQECFAQMDQSAMQSLNAKGEKMRAEVEALCAAGKRDEAQSAAMNYGKEIAKSKEMQEMKKCGEMAQHMMQQMPHGPEGDFSGTGHVCDRR